MLVTIKVQCIALLTGTVRIAYRCGGQGRGAQGDHSDEEHQAAEGSFSHAEAGEDISR